MLKSFRGLVGIDPGFDASGILTVYMYPPAAKYATPDDVARLSEEVLERVRGLPGVSAASSATPLPLADDEQRNTHIFEDFPPDPGQLPPFHPIRRIATGYFRTMGIPLVAGRVFEPADLHTPHGAVVVSDSLARHYWPLRAVQPFEVRRAISTRPPLICGNFSKDSKATAPGRPASLPSATGSKTAVVRSSS